MHGCKIRLGGRLSAVALAPVVDIALPPESAPSVPAPPVAPPSPPPEVPLFRSALGQLQQLIAKQQSQQVAACTDMAHTAVELAVQLTERLVRTEIAADRQRLERVVLDALERMQPTRVVTVRGHADDLALLQRQLAEETDAAAYRELLIFRPDHQHERGNLRLECDDWSIDFDTRRALAELRELLLEETCADEAP